MLVLASVLLRAQPCPRVFDFNGQTPTNPFWYSCTGDDFSFNLSTPNTWNGFTINWGDGSPVTSGSSWGPPTFQNHLYAAAVTTYTVTITETSTGCTVIGTVVMEEATSASIQIPVGGVTQACAPQTMEFINSSTNVSGTTQFTWDFGDGSPPLSFNSTNLGQTISHTYQQGTVDCETEVTLTAQNMCNMVQGGSSTATFNPIRIWDIDDAAISASATVLCYPDTTVTLTNATERNCLFQGNIFQRYESWNFGDYWGTGEDSIIDWTPWPPSFPRTLHLPGIGSYTIQLADSNFCGVANTSLTIQIVPPPTAQIAVSTDTVCVGQPITFFQQSFGGANVFKWNFGNNATWFTTGSGNLSYQYNAPGTYQVGSAVSVSGSSGCADTAFVTVVVLPNPLVAISADQTEGCDQLQVDFTAVAPDAVQWVWNLDNGTPAFNGLNPPLVNYTQPGEYHVTLEVENSFGCAAEDDITIEVYQSPQVDFNVFNVCEGAVAQFTDLTISASNNDITEWAWSFGDGTVSDQQNPTHTYTGTGSFLVQLFITTEHCPGQTSENISVQEAPVASLAADVLVGCTPLVVNFDNLSEPAASYVWDLGNGILLNDFAGQQTFFNFGTADTTYQVTLGALNSFGCGTTDMVEIVVHPGAIANFTDNSTPPTCGPLEAFFQNESQNAFGYSWNFGDGFTSNVASPSHTYFNNTNFLDVFEVTLIAFNQQGCNDTLSKTVFVYPLINLNPTIETSEGCAPLTVTMPFVGGAQIYQWDFGDGTSSTFAMPVHTFNNTTSNEIVYDVTLIGTSAFGCSDTVVTQITVFPNSVAQFNTNVASGCSPLTVDITNLSSGADTYNWNYGDGGVSQVTALQHSHTFINNGTTPLVRTIALATQNIYGCLSSFSANLEIYPQINVSFVEPVDVCSPATVSFSNTSINVSSYSWNFGNGLQSVALNPTSVYENITDNDVPYTVTLTGSSVFGCVDSMSHTFLVKTTPTALFTLSELAACAPVEVEISNQTVRADNLLWTYGNGITSTTEDSLQQIVYQNKGTIAQEFVITLLATTDEGCSSQQSSTLTVYPLIDAGFIEPSAYCAPATVQFNSTSVNANSLQWDFGNGTVSTIPAPTSFFVNDTGDPIVYDVQLVATSTYGCVDSINHPVVVNPTPVIDFSPSVFSGCAPVEVTFTNNSLFADNILWSYGDGAGSTTTDAIHTHLYTNTGLAPDFVDVTLSAVSDEGCNSSTTVELSIYPGVTAGFLSPGSFCSPAQLALVNTSQNAVTFEWSFGNGLMSIMPNPTTNYSNTSGETEVYDITLLAANAYGCVDSVEQQVTVFATPLVDVLANVNAGCSPLVVTFANETTFADNIVWQYGDNTSSNTTASQHAHTFVNNGTDAEDFEVFMQASTLEGCAAQANFVIQVYPNVEAEFEDPGAYCSPVSLGFINTSQNGASYQWNFANGMQSIMENPVVFFSNNSDTTQVFDVSLLVTSAYGCESQYSAPLTVYPLPNASFVLNETNACEPGPLTMFNNSTGAASYMWDYGDGTASITAATAHTHDYSNAPFQTNSYTILLVATSADGCVDQSQLNYTIYPDVVALFTTDTMGCSPHLAPLINQSVGAVSYQWNFSDGQTSSQTSPALTFNAPFDLDVDVNAQLIATNVFGCSDTIVRTIHVMHTPQAIAQIDSVYGCYPSTVVFYNGSIGADGYNWQYGTGQSSSTAEEFHEHQYVNITDELFTFNITLQAYTDYGCISSDQLTLDVPPEVQADFNSIQQGCTPLEVFFDNTSEGGTSVEWHFGDGDNSNAYEPQHTFFNFGTNDTTYTVELLLYDNFGCADTVTQEILVFADPVAGFEVTPQSQLWPSATIDITNTTVGGNLGATWNMSDGSFLFDVNPGSYTYETWGEFTIQLVVSNGLCSDTTYRTIEILPPAPVANFAGPAEGCAPLRVEFTNLSENAVVSTWSFGDGNQSTAQNPVYTYYQPGIYTVALNVVGPDGSSNTLTQEQIIYVYANATASFAVTPTNVNVPGEPVYCLNLSANASSYYWDFGDGETSTEENPLHYYQERGEYDITLIAVNGNGCSDTLTLLGLIEANDVGEIEFPNAFTPDPLTSSGGYYNPNSLDNDVFFPIHKGVDEYKLQIYNKWGELLFESIDIDKGWDGYYRGKLVKQDVYVWKVEAKFVNGQKYDKAGDVTILIK
ncbi:MAG: PKD domain-containing protein [Flavobacteriales bacterium]